MEYVMLGKLLTHLREQRSRTVSLFQFTDADLQGDTDQSRISSKDLTKYAYGVAKGMEFLVSKGVSWYSQTSCGCIMCIIKIN